MDFPLRENNLNNEYVETDGDETLRAAFLSKTIWDPNQKIKISFLDGEEWKRKWVEKVVLEKLQPVVNLRFRFGDYGMNGDIRISFQNQNTCYSRLGKESLSKQSPESMNLGWLDPPKSYNFSYKGKKYYIPRDEHRNNFHDISGGGTILHEFGHAIGMIHEHQNPRGKTMDWNVTAVMNEFGGPPNNWDKLGIQNNILNKYDKSQINGSDFDPNSIMLYGYPPDLTLNNIGTNANYKLSKIDIKWMQLIYGSYDNNNDNDNDNDDTTKIKIFGYEFPKFLLLGIFLAIIVLLLILGFVL
jgi:hypothetical protein